MVYRVEVTKTDEQWDVTGKHIMSQIAELGIDGVKNVRYSNVSYLDIDSVDLSGMRELALDLLADRITETVDVRQLDTMGSPATDRRARTIEVLLNHGVTDSTAMRIRDAVALMGYRCHGVKVSRSYRIIGEMSEESVSLIGRRILYNPVVEHVAEPGESPFPIVKAVPPEVVKLPLADMGDTELMDLSQNRLWLNLEEMRAMRAYFVRSKRDATDVEIETIAQTWSEHSSHKVFRSRIFVDGIEQQSIIHRLKEVTGNLNKDWCWSVFVDNSGVVELDDKWGICFKVETHNKPSSIEPFGGAHTGAGGVIRDIMGTGLGGKPIANTNVLCFAPPDTDWADIPAGLLHPKRVMRRVIAGIQDYGNKMGIPTVGGAVCFSAGFLGVPLVFAGCLGIVEKENAKKRIPVTGDRVVLIGGRTGRDGIHGATFSSGTLTHRSETVSSQSVQIGHPFVEKKLLDAQMDMKEEKLYRALTDCGGGGLSSAIGEIGAPTGVMVELSNVPLKYPLPFVNEYWISESQERMVLAVPPENLKRVEEVCRRHDVLMADLGEFTDDHKLVLRFKGEIVADLTMEFLHKGCPQREFHLPAPVKIETQSDLHAVPSPKDLKTHILSTLAHPDVCSKENIARVYDHEVQARTVVKPYMGPSQHSPSDGAVLTPLYGSPRGVIIGHGINVRYGVIDPYRMALSVVDEAVRQVILLGGRPDRIAILDNFALPSPEVDKTIVDLHLAVNGLCEAAVCYETPVISGKDSFYNEFRKGDGSAISVPPVLLVSALGFTDDVTRTAPSHLVSNCSFVYLLGKTSEELDGSCYFQQTHQRGTHVPTVSLIENKALYREYHRALQEGLILSAHDCSDGGLAVTASEMVIGGSVGLELDVSLVDYDGRDRPDFVLFSESNGRILVEVAHECTDRFEEIMRSVSCTRIGKTKPSHDLSISDHGSGLLSCSWDELYKAWSSPIARII